MKNESKVNPPAAGADPKAWLDDVEKHGVAYGDLDRLIAIAKAAQEMAKTLDEVVRCIERNMGCLHSGSDDGGDECDADDCIRCFVVGIGRTSLEAYHKAVESSKEPIDTKP